MPTFLWEAKNRTGETRTGQMEAESSDAVAQKLRSQRLQVTRIRRKPLDLLEYLPVRTGISLRDLMVFTRQFAVMIDAGLPMVRCLEVLSKQADNEKFGRVIMRVKIAVESGKTLADALEKEPRVFDRLFVSLVEAGETGGVLDSIMMRLAVYMEKSYKLRKQVKGALMYPALVLFVSLAVTVAMLVYVMPVFAKMFSEFGHELPRMTQMAINVSNFTRDNFGFIIAIGLGGWILLWMSRRTKTGQRFWDTQLLGLPAMGSLLRKIAVAKFSRTMGTMLSSGVPILDALEVAAGTSGSLVIEEGLLAARDEIAEGKPMSQPLGELGIFPPMVVQMIAVGETSGGVDTMLNKIADFYDDEVDSASATVMAAFEPIMMIVLALILGGLVISMYLPVFTMAGTVGAG